MSTLKKSLIVVLSVLLMSSAVFAEEKSVKDNRLMNPTIALVAMPGIIELNEETQAFDGLLLRLVRPILIDMGLNPSYAFVRLAEAFSGDYDIVLGGINVNYEREQAMDFSVSYLTSGLSIMLPYDADVAWYEYGFAVIQAMLYPVIIFLVYIIISGHILWWKERGIDSITDKYSEGVREGMWIAFQIGTTIGSGDMMPRTWGGRSMAVPTYFAGVFVFAYVISVSGSAIDSLEESSAIQGPSDLKGLVVVMKMGSASIPIVESLGAKVVLVESISEASEYINSERADAGVFDQPVVADFLQNNSGFKTTASTFNEKTYHVAVAERHSGMLEEFNRKLLQKMQTQEYKMLCDWYLKRACY